MKTTLVLDDALVAELKAAASRSGSTMSEITEAALRRYLSPPAEEREVALTLPTADLGPARVDIADREALYDFLDADR